MMGRARGSHLTSAIWQGTLCPKKEVKMILKETARARGVSPGEPGESHAARFQCI